MGRRKKSWEQISAERSAERELAEMREWNRLAELTTMPTVKAQLEDRANGCGRRARRWQDRATELEYAHLYEEMEIG